MTNLLELKKKIEITLDGSETVTGEVMSVFQSWFRRWFDENLFPVLQSLYDELEQKKSAKTARQIAEDFHKILTDPHTCKDHTTCPLTDELEQALLSFRSSRTKLLTMDDVGKRITARDFHDLGLQMMQVSESEDVIEVINRILSLLSPESSEGAKEGK